MVIGGSWLLAPGSWLLAPGSWLLLTAQVCPKSNCSGRIFDVLYLFWSGGLGEIWGYGWNAFVFAGW
jgi:hypothetical protein